MADNTIIDYNKLNKFLPDSLRNFCGAVNRMNRMDFRAFMPMYQGVEQMAVFNNANAAQFASGFTDLNYMYLRSGVAPRLLDILVSKTIGRVYYQTKIEESTLNEKFDKDYFSDCLYKSFDEAAMTGRSVLVMYQEDAEKEINLLSYNLFRHRVIFDKHKNIIEAFLFITKIDGDNAGSEFVVCEHRFLDTIKDGNETLIDQPCQEFLVYGISYQQEDKKDAKYNAISDVRNIPQTIQTQFSDLVFNKPRKLTFNGIGVFDIKYTLSNKKFIDSDIPEAMFTDAVDNALIVDTSITDKEVEKEVGRGQILMPDFGSGGIDTYQTQASVGANTLRTVSTHYKNPIFQKYPSMRMEDSKPMNVQFDIRSEQWTHQINDDIARLCASVGISVLDFDPRLLQSGQRTDDEINAMTDITANTVTRFRNINTKKVNDLLNAVVDALKLEKPVAIKWSMASILNPTKNTDLIIKQLQSGLISRKAAIRRINPDLTDSEVDQIYKEVENEVSAQDINTAFSGF